MFILGLTGGSGCGKGYIANFFAKRGIYSIDTDCVSRSVTVAGQPCLNEIVSEFGSDILAIDGTLLRRKLGEIVFSDSLKLERLNTITHKYILAECRKWLDERESAGDFAAIVDAPVLFESKFNLYCHYTIGIVADTECRINRIIKRDNITREIAIRRIAAQKPNEFYIENCDFIIYNGSDIKQPELQADLVYQQIRWV